MNYVTMDSPFFDTPVEVLQKNAEYVFYDKSHAPSDVCILISKSDISKTVFVRAESLWTNPLTKNMHFDVLVMHNTDRSPQECFELFDQKVEALAEHARYTKRALLRDYYAKYRNGPSMNHDAL